MRWQGRGWYLLYSLDSSLPKGLDGLDAANDRHVTSIRIRIRNGISTVLLERRFSIIN